MKKAKYLLVAGLALVVLLFVRSGPAKIMEAVRHADLFSIVVAILFTTLSQVVRALKWQTLLNVISEERIPLRAFLPVYLLNGMLSNFTPAKSGDFFGTLFFRKFFRTPVGGGVSIILLDRLIELLVLCLGILVSAGYFFRQLHDGLSMVKILLAVVAFLVLAMAVLVFIALSARSTGRIVGYLENRWGNNSPESRIHSVKAELGRFHQGFQELNAARLYGYLVPLTLAAWGCDICSTFFLFSSVLKLDFVYAMMSFWVSVGIGIVTFIPLGLGSSEISFYYFLKLQGQPESLAVAGILLTRFIPLFTMVLFGVCSYVILNRRSGQN